MGPGSIKLSQGIIFTVCKSTTFFFSHSPSEYCGADENILYFLQPVAVGADDFLCIGPGGMTEITYMVFNVTMGYSRKG